MTEPRERSINNSSNTESVNWSDWSNRPTALGNCKNLSLSTRCIFPVRHNSTGQETVDEEIGSRHLFPEQKASKFATFP